jgi:hypothetical protein
MTQLDLFDNNDKKVPRHYDRESSFNLFKYHQKNPEIMKSRDSGVDNSNSIDAIKSSDRQTIDDFANIKCDVESLSKTLKKMDMYSGANVSAKKDYLMKNHPKFSEKGVQTIQNYTDEKIFGLFKNFKESYEVKLKKRNRELKEFYERNDDVLKKYNL